MTAWALAFRLQQLEQEFVGGEQSRNEELRQRRHQRKTLANQRKMQLIEALNQNSEEGDSVLLNVYDSIQEELHAKSKVLENKQEKVSSLWSSWKWNCQSETEHWIWVWTVPPMGSQYVCRLAGLLPWLVQLNSPSSDFVFTFFTIKMNRYCGGYFKKCVSDVFFLFSLNSTSTRKQFLIPGSWDVDYYYYDWCLNIHTFFH